MNELIIILINSVISLIGFAIVAWVFGSSLAHGLSNVFSNVFEKVLNKIPEWIHAYIKETREYKAIAEARSKMDELRK